MNNERFINALKDNNMTKAELSRKLGINRSAISQYLSGATNPSLETLIGISDCLHVSLFWLLGYDDIGKDIAYDFSQLDPDGQNRVLTYMDDMKKIYKRK